MQTIKKIVAAVDFSACSEDAFRQAARIAEHTGAALEACYVVPLPVYINIPEFGVPFEPPVAADVVIDARRRWEAFAPDCPAHGHTLFNVEFGVPRVAIAEIVRKKRADLLVLGAHSDSDARRGIGTTASACIERAPVRVLVVHPGRTAAFHTVVACIDFSDVSRLALEQAIEAAALDDARLHVLHVYSDPWRGRPAPAIVTNNMPDFDAKYHQSVETRLRQFCEPYVHELNALNAAYHVIQVANHAEGIVAFTQRHGCDLAVLGTQAHWNMHDFLWGTTAERVVRECPCSTLTIHPPDRPRAMQPSALADRGVDREPALL